MGEKTDENPDFQGFSENFVGLEGVFPSKSPSREVQEAIADMEKRLARVQRSLLSYKRTPPRALRQEEELLQANLAHFKRRWGL